MLERFRDRARAVAFSLAFPFFRPFPPTGRPSVSSLALSSTSFFLYWRSFF